MMDRKEVKTRLQTLLVNRCSTCRYGDKKCTQDCEFEQAVNMAIEALSTDAVQGVGRYENAMQKLRDMPRYLNGVKEKQITKISTNYTTEKPNDIVEQKNDVVAEPTDLISRADVLDIITFKRKLANIDGRILLDETVDRINALPSAEQVTSKLKNPCDSLLKDDSESCKEQKSKLDLISRADAIRWVKTECNPYGKPTLDFESGKKVIEHLEQMPSAGRPSGEWIPCTKNGLVLTELIRKEGVAKWYGYKCSECNYIHRGNALIECNYCQNCGAKMGSDTR